MFDNILSQLTQQALPKLMNEHGLSKEQAQASIASAATSVQQTLGGEHGFGMDTLLNLFSNAQNSGQANSLLGQIGQTMQGHLANNASLSPAQAGSVKDTLLPMITNLISQHVGGQQGNLQSLLGGFTGGGGGIGQMAGGLLGKLFQ